MPRRKKLDDLIDQPTPAPESPTVPETATPEETPKKRAPRKKAEAPEVVVSEAPAPAEKPAPRTRKKAVAAVVEPEAGVPTSNPLPASGEGATTEVKKPARAPRKKPEIAAPAKPVAKPAAKLPPPQPKSTTKTLAELVEESGEDVDSVVVPEPPKRKPLFGRERKPAPVAATPEPAAPVTFVETETATEGDLVFTFRKREGGASKSAAKPAPKPVSNEPIELPDIENPPLLSWRSAGPDTPRGRMQREPREKPLKRALEAPKVVVKRDVEDLTDYDALAQAHEAPAVAWRSASQVPVAKSAKPALEPLEVGDDLPPVEFRSREGESASDAGNDRKRRSRRGRRDSDEPIAEPQAKEALKAEPKVELPPLPVPPAPKPLIPTPEEAPQVVMRGGLPTLVRNKRVYPPIAVYGNTRDGQRMQNVLEEMQMAGQAGVHLFVHQLALVIDPKQVREAISRAEELLEQSVKQDFDGQIIFRVTFTSPHGWADNYPNARYNNRSGKLAEPSVCDDDYWSVAGDCLAELVRALRKHRLREHLMGIQLDRGGWYYPEADGYDVSKAAVTKFRDWARARYRNDVVSLRAAWFDGGVNFDTLRVPEQPREDEAEKEDKFVRANRKERKWVDYHLMLSDQTEALIGDLAYTVKEASDGYFLVGTNYGYTFEWQHPASGHLGLGKLLRCPEIDFVAGPPSYKNREPGGAASFPGPIDSFPLNGKLYLSEEDFKTSLGVGYDPDEHNPTLKTPQALESVHWRGVGAALAHGSGVNWMDSYGNGWLKTSSVWNRAKVVREALIRRMASPPSDPDVAVFIDERALAYLVDQKGFALLVQNVRESIMRAGMSAAFYLLSDLQHRENFPESKLYLFLNGWDIRSELRASIKHRLQRDNKLLFWLYSAALFDNGRESLERAREVTGIALKPQPFHSRTGTTILNRRHPLCEAFREKTAIGGTRLEPSYFAIPEDGVVLGEYSGTGLPSFIYRQMKHETDPNENWQAVFLGEPIVTPDLLRALGNMAGAHVWSFNDDVVHVRAPFLTVHCTGAGMRTIALPGKWCAYNLIEQEWVQTESASMRFHATDGSTHCFLVGTREEVEGILSVDPAGLLRMEELPTRGENTIREDAFSFDVPMMKLGEFMDSGDTDELTDDLLFKPALLDGDSMSDESDSEPEKVGRRRRKRTPNREKSGRRDSYSNELDLGVVFRKRD
jgi:hypothetical protein